MPTLNPTSSPGLFAPPIFSGKSPRDEVALNPTLMALRLMDGTRPNFSYPNSCYMYVTSKYAEDSKHDPHKALVPGVSLLTLGQSLPAV